MLTKTVLKRVTNRVNEMNEDSTLTTETLMKNIKMSIMKAMNVKGLPLGLAEEVACMLILLVSKNQTMTVK